MLDIRSWSNYVIRTPTAFALLFVLNACTTTSPVPPIAPPQNWPLLAPATLGRAVQVKQILRGAFGGKEINLQCVVTVQPQQLTVIGLTSLGLRAFSVTYDGEQVVEERATQMPDSIRGERLINDIQFAFWSLPALQTALQGTGWEISEPFPGTRRLSRDGNLIAEVHYADSNPWSGRIWPSFSKPIAMPGSLRAIPAAAG